ncbi:MAG: DUF3455 domain-containing protein [Betaproteobacteria bacterium]|nr:DUF3455 domain-containing protein [Betaproteobacteria bacterium]
MTMYQRMSAVALLLLLNAGCATTDAPIEVSVPDAIKPGPHESLAFVTPANGVQIYECRASKNRPGAYEWAFVAPDADLFDHKGDKVGRHYAGPHWELADGSKIVASVKARADAPRADAIPWLLLSARSVGPEGPLSKVSSIQRMSTQGGLAPKNGCSQATAGQSARVHYTANYYFFNNGK